MAAIMGGVALAGAAGIVAGLLIWRDDGEESALSAALIGIGILATIMGTAFCVMGLWGRAVILRIYKGKNLIARWRVSPADLDVFRSADAARSARGPEFHAVWTPPDPSPAEGLEVRFAADAVLMGDDYFALPVIGLVNFSAVQPINATLACLEFRVNWSEARGATVQWLKTQSSLLRVPTSPDAPDEAARALDHFRRVLTREIVVNPGFWTIRIRIGLWVAAVSALVAVGGWQWPKFMPDPGHIGDAVMICAIMVGLGGLVVAGASYARLRAQRGR